jgi:hypothetical protein
MKCRLCGRERPAASEKFRETDRGTLSPDVLQVTESKHEESGESGIRTHGGVTPTHAFQACSLNHSDISPELSDSTIGLLEDLGVLGRYRHYTMSI